MPKGIYNRNTAKGVKGLVWLDVHDAFLTELVKDKRLSFAECVAPMNTRFAGDEDNEGRTYTRSALIGRARRMGLEAANPRGPHHMHHAKKAKGDKRITVKRKKADAVPHPAIRTDAENRLGQSHAEGKRRASAAEIAERRKGFVPDVVDPSRTSKPIADCADDECRWPASADVNDLNVCGRPATYGAYCDEHGQRAYRVAPTQKRNATFHKVQDEHTKRLEHSPSVADQDVIPQFLVARDDLLMIEYKPSEEEA